MHYSVARDAHTRLISCVHCNRCQHTVGYSHLDHSEDVTAISKMEVVEGILEPFGNA